MATAEFQTLRGDYGDSMVRKFRIFLSYGDEALRFKERVKNLAEQAFAKTLENADGPAILNVIEWRDLPARRAPGGGKTNDLLVLVRFRRHLSPAVRLLVKGAAHVEKAASLSGPVQARSG